MDGPDLLQRVSNVCNYYRGGSWTLNYDSDDGGYWSLQLKSPIEQGEEQQSMPTPFGFLISGPPNYPIFAIRCQELEVVAEAIEHWHAGVLSREPRPN